MPAPAPGCRPGGRPRRRPRDRSPDAGPCRRALPDRVGAPPPDAATRGSWCPHRVARSCWAPASAAPPGFSRAGDPRAQRGFEIQQHEVTWRELTGWLGAHPQAGFAPARRRPGPARGGVPGACQRLLREPARRAGPSEEQWSMPARRPLLRPNPWGPRAAPQNRSWPTAASTPSRRRHDQPSGRHPGDAGSAIHDLAGNAQEWTADVWRGNEVAGDESWVTRRQDLPRVRGLPLREPRPRAIQRTAPPIARRCARGAVPRDTVQPWPQVGFRCVRPCQHPGRPRRQAALTSALGALLVGDAGPLASSALCVQVSRDQAPCSPRPRHSRPWRCGRSSPSGRNQPLRGPRLALRAVAPGAAVGVDAAVARLAHVLALVAAPAIAHRAPDSHGQPCSGRDGTRCDAAP